MCTHTHICLCALSGQSAVKVHWALANLSPSNQSLTNEDNKQRKNSEIALLCACGTHETRKPIGKDTLWPESGTKRCGFEETRALPSREMRLNKQSSLSNWCAHESTNVFSRKSRVDSKWNLIRRKRGNKLTLTNG